MQSTEQLLPASCAQHAVASGFHLLFPHIFFSVANVLVNSTITKNLVRKVYTLRLRMGLRSLTKNRRNTENQNFRNKDSAPSKDWGRAHQNILMGPRQ